MGMNETTAMMKCGHSANAVRVHDDGTRTPACAICTGLTPDAQIVDETPPTFEGRMARCSYGDHADVPSGTRLAFFESTPDRPFDRYYCGCYGWD